MKTNHKRGFKEKRDPNVVFSRYTVFAESVKLELSGRSVNAHVTCGDHTNGKRGIAKDRRGPKNSCILVDVSMKKWPFKKWSKQVLM